MSRFGGDCANRRSDADNLNSAYKVSILHYVYLVHYDFRFAIISGVESGSYNVRARFVSQ